MRRKRVSMVLAPCLVVAWVQIAAAQTGASAGRSPTDSPYENGPPPVTGGYTDTSQGGTKTSGDMPVPPPSSGGQDQAAKRGQQKKSQESPQQGEEPVGKARGGVSDG